MSSTLEAKPKSTSSVFISYRTSEPDLSLARKFGAGISQAGVSVFMAAESIRWGDDWPARIDAALAACDIFLLLLSQESATSEMVTEEVRRAKWIREKSPARKPLILPVRVRCPNGVPLNYDLDGYLARIQQQTWESDHDTSRLIDEVLRLLAGGLETATSPEPPPVVCSVNRGPLPVAEPELPEGQVDLESSFYTFRAPIEQNCFAAISKPSCLIRIKAPRQMGKTSLLSRALQHGRSLGYQAASLSFQLADSAVFSDLGSFLAFFVSAVAWKLGVEEPNLSTAGLSGLKIRCTSYFERKILPALDSPLVLGLDEVDLVFDHAAMASDFFGLLRAWHEESKSNKLWRKLKLVIVHSTEVYIPLKINQSPFNVGLPLALREFNHEQVSDLAKRHGLAFSQEDVTKLLQVVGGHPYLTRVVLYEMATFGHSLDDLLTDSSAESGPFGDHLRRHLWNLQQHPELGSAMRALVATDRPVAFRSEVEFKLESMGLVERDAGGIKPRYDLYRQYFKYALIRSLV